MIVLPTLLVRDTKEQVSPIIVLCYKNMLQIVIAGNCNFV